jgi:hypothetical protein
MNQIEQAINNLSSPKKNTRYEACEEMRVADGLPASAITALEAATHDPDPLVADAARRALASHMAPSTPAERIFPMNNKSRIPLDQYILYGLFGAFIGFLIYLALDVLIWIRMGESYGRTSQDNYYYLACPLIIFITGIGGLIGAISGVISGRIWYLNKPRIWASVGAATLGGIIGSVLSIPIFIGLFTFIMNRLFP